MKRDEGLSALGFSAVIALAAYRVWAFIALDDLTRPVRMRVFRNDRRPVLKLWWMCPWCAGTWITVGIAFLACRRIPTPVLVAVAAAAGTALLGGNDERLMTAESEVD